MLRKTNFQEIAILNCILINKNKNYYYIIMHMRMGYAEVICILSPTMPFQDIHNRIVQE